MIELSFFIECNNDSYGIETCIESIVSLLRDYALYEIIVINRATSEAINQLIADIEKRHSDIVLLVNCDASSRDEDVTEIGLQYANGTCFLKLDPKEIFEEKTIDRLLYDANLINEDEFKFLRDKYHYIIQSAEDANFKYSVSEEQKCLNDHKEGAGNVDMHYFFQDIYVAQKVRHDGVEEIYDIGSRVDGYISHLLSMNIKVTMIDVRPLPYEIENLHFIQGNATNLNDIPDGSIQFLSSLHAVEHFGLGRYGDPIDYDAWRKALSEFARVIAYNGKLYLSVPVGNRETVKFNAHRIFSPYTIVSWLQNGMKLLEFSFIHNGKRNSIDFSHEEDIEVIKKVLQDTSRYALGEYDCGIFIFEKRRLV